MIVVGLGYAAAAALLAAAAASRSPVPARLGLRPRPRRDLLQALGRRVPWTPPVLAERLGILARPADVDRLRGAAAVCALMGLIGGTLVTAPSPAAVGVGILAAVAGWRLPAFTLARRAASARGHMMPEVAALLDLVTVGLSAGLTPRLAFDRAVDHVAEPLREALVRVRREVALGASWPASLDHLGRRFALPDLRRLASTLDQSIRLGAPVADPMRSLARDVRAERDAAVEARARRAPVTMLFPLVLCILPAFVLAAVLPAMLVATRGVP
ncbi:MAG TPA: type II secretion system F family protein [Actinomycetota bacterium]